MLKEKSDAPEKQKLKSMAVNDDNKNDDHKDKSPMTISYNDTVSGRVEIEADLCKGCFLCIEACPPGVLVMSKSLNKMGYRPVEYKGEDCTGCGICFYICPEPGSIRVYKRKKAAQPQE